MVAICSLSRTLWKYQRGVPWRACFFHPAVHIHESFLMAYYQKFSGRCLVSTIAFVFKQLPCLCPWVILSSPLMILLPSTQGVSFSSIPVTNPGYFLYKYYYLHLLWSVNAKGARPANGIEWLLYPTILAGKGSQDTWCLITPLVFFQPGMSQECSTGVCVTEGQHTCVSDWVGQRW